tara:strand:+ start:492 stop:1649 length:1158 start_codon:yes stop_codon:yes gene_type:complete
MATRTATAAITLTDLKDGQDSVTAFLTNENHSFVANDAGTVHPDTIGLFSSYVKVFVGGTLQTYSVGTNPQAGKFGIGPLSSSSTGWEFTVDTSTGEIKADAIGSANINKVTVPVYYNNEGSVNNFSLEISVNRVQDGAGGTVINLTPSSQMFSADANGVMLPSQLDADLEIDVTGSPGALSYETSKDGDTYVGQTSTSDNAGGIAGYDTDGSGTYSTGTIPTDLGNGARLLIKKENLGTSVATLTVRVKGVNAGKDAVTFAKVRSGAGAVYVNIVPNNGIFRNNSGAPITAIAKVYDATTGLPMIDAGNGNFPRVEYDWEYLDGTQVFYDAGTGVISTGANGTPNTDGTSAAGYGLDQLIIGPSNIPDTGEPVSITCTVTVTTE